VVVVMPVVAEGEMVGVLFAGIPFAGVERREVLRAAVEVMAARGTR
jgi:hypothetical protein